MAASALLFLYTVPCALHQAIQRRLIELFTAVILSLRICLVTKALL